MYVNSCANAQFTRVFITIRKDLHIVNKRTSKIPTKISPFIAFASAKRGTEALQRECQKRRTERDFYYQLVRGLGLGARRRDGDGAGAISEPLTSAITAVLETGTKQSPLFLKYSSPALESG